MLHVILYIEVCGTGRHSLYKGTCHASICTMYVSMYVCTVGSKEEMNQMMSDYLDGKYDLFGAKTSTRSPPPSNSSLTTPLASSSKTNAPPSLSTESSLLHPPSSGVGTPGLPTVPPSKKRRKISGEIMIYK